MSRVLLLEDHTALRESMARALATIPAAIVSSVGTIERAKAALSATPHDLVVSDLDLPDGSGIELIGHAGCGSEIPIIYVSAHLPKFRAQLRDYPGITVREKPISLQELKRLATNHLEQAAAAAEAPFGAGDYIQLACIGRHSVRIDVTAPGVRGAIVVRDGRLWSAATADERGVTALRRLAFADHAIVRCSTLRQSNVERSDLPDAPWEQLLLDAAREHDEHTHGSTTRKIECVDDPLDFGSLLADEDEAPSPPRPPVLPRTRQEIPRVATPTSLVASDAFELELERGAEALLAKDYPVALRAYERARSIRPDDRMVLANVARLTEIVARQNPSNS